MQKISTINLLIKSLYEPLTAEEQRRVNLLEESDKNRFAELKSHFKRFRKSPSTTSVNLILSYSKYYPAELDAIL